MTFCGRLKLFSREKRKREEEIIMSALLPTHARESLGDMHNNKGTQKKKKKKGGEWRVK